MNDIQHIITERVDDIPLLLEQMQRMELPTLIDHHFPATGKEAYFVLGSYVSLILEANTRIWKFSFPRVNELKTKPRLLGRLGLWWQISGQLSLKTV